MRRRRAATRPAATTRGAARQRSARREHAWHIEAGWKSSLAGGKVAASAALFFIDWDDLQLNVPNPFVPGQFYITNVGGARSNGVEFDVTARPMPAIDVFGSFGYTNASFSDGTMTGAVDLSGNSIPFTPDFTALLGAQWNPAVTSSINGFVRGEAVFTGAFHDEANTRGQEACSLVNFRAGARSSTSARCSCAMPSRRATCRSPFPTSLRSRGSSARMAARAPSGSASA